MMCFLISKLSRFILLLCVFIPVITTLASNKPNVVFILIDDLSHYGVSAYGATHLNSTQFDNSGKKFFETVAVATPEIDRIASEGMLANNAFAYPICEPTRVALMTGMNNNRNFIQAKALHASQITFGDIFRKAGYVTGIAGKWKQSRGTAKIPGQLYVEQFGWDHVHCFDLLYEGARHIDPNFVINGKIRWYNKDLDPLTGRRYYGPDLANQFALNFIQENKERPFFLYYPMLLVHDEHTPTPDTIPKNSYDSFSAMTHTGVPAENQYGVFKGDDRRYYPDMIRYMDKMIGRIIKKLEIHNLRENTLIVIMGDNGTKACFSYTLSDGTEFIGGKGQCRTNGMQVPLILSWPNVINKDTQYSGLINVTDLLPTLCEAANIELPNPTKLDGISFWPQATAKNPAIALAHRDYIYTWYNANRLMSDSSKRIEYIQELNYKRYAPNRHFPKGRFFDLRTDPFELRDDYNSTANIGSGIQQRSGCNISNLTKEQRQAYLRLGEILTARSKYIAVEKIDIKAPKNYIKANDSMYLTILVDPADATQSNIIWSSSDPTIATVDKFGIVKGHKSGTVTISADVWNHEQPIAAGKNSTNLSSEKVATMALRVDR